MFLSRFISLFSNKTKHQSPMNNAHSEYFDDLKLIKEYRPELQKYTTSILAFNTLAKYHGLLTILNEYVLTQTGIGDGIHMCGFGFPDTIDNEPSFFTQGVCFNYGYDTEPEVISDKEFVWLIEDTCNIYKKNHQSDTQQLDRLLNKIRLMFHGCFFLIC